ncbi:putative uncharacterized protein FRMD6-AS1 [Rhinopithecus roxellana]|uniref:putative uncharacterized protein FRMD6-AS1 n=1 Tax=Rhinopithecus roxellana TaxID=61622 RepID=UPI0012379C36|nr:putative uncharacterized protein FRMD6-AS1 [Rhinopithecus roxellana]
MDARGRRAGSRGPTEGTPGRRAASTSAPRVAPPPPAGLGRRSRRGEGGLGNPAGEKDPADFPDAQPQRKRTEARAGSALARAGQLCQERAPWHLSPPGP